MTGKFCKFNKNELKTNFLNDFFSENFGSSLPQKQMAGDPVPFGLIPTRVSPLTGKYNHHEYADFDAIKCFVFPSAGIRFLCLPSPSHW